MTAQIRQTSIAMDIPVSGQQEEVSKTQTSEQYTKKSKRKRNKLLKTEATLDKRWMRVEESGMTEFQRAICEAFDELEQQGATGDEDTIRAALAYLEEHNRTVYTLPPRRVGPPEAHYRTTSEVGAILAVWGGPYLRVRGDRARRRLYTYDKPMLLPSTGCRNWVTRTSRHNA